MIKKMAVLALLCPFIAILPARAEDIPSDRAEIRGLVMSIAARLDADDREGAKAMMRDKDDFGRAYRLLKAADLKNTYDESRLSICGDKAFIDYRNAGRPGKAPFLIMLRKLSGRWRFQTLL